MDPVSASGVSLSWTCATAGPGCVEVEGRVLCGLFSLLAFHFFLSQSLFLEEGDLYFLLDVTELLLVVSGSLLGTCGRARVC